jgi:hypothetical protein
MKVFILKETWTESYDCPENGPTEICETFTIVAASQDKQKLEAMAENLGKGYHNGFWSSERTKELRAIYPDYDFCRNSIFTVEELELI